MHWRYMPPLFLNTGLKCLQHGWLLFPILFHQWNPSVCLIIIIIYYIKKSSDLVWCMVCFEAAQFQWTADVMTHNTNFLAPLSWEPEMVVGVGWQQWHRLVRRQWCKDESSNTLPHSQHTGGELRRICDYSRQCSLFCRLHQNKAKC